MPDTMQFVARQVRIDVPRLDDVAVLVALGGEAIVVVRHVHLLLAHQFPVVAVR
ncbi:hypothetical protein D3C81_2179360 [compost metagenome]